MKLRSSSTMHRANLSPLLGEIPSIDPARSTATLGAAAARREMRGSPICPMRRTAATAARASPSAIWIMRVIARSVLLRAGLSLWKARAWRDNARAIGGIGTQVMSAIFLGIGRHSARVHDALRLGLSVGGERNEPSVTPKRRGETSGLEVSSMLPEAYRGCPSVLLVYSVIGEIVR